MEKKIKKVSKKEFSDIMLQIAVGLFPKWGEFIDMKNLDKDKEMFRDAFHLAKKFIEVRDELIESEHLDIED